MKKVGKVGLIGALVAVAIIGVYAFSVKKQESNVSGDYKGRVYGVYNKSGAKVPVGYVGLSISGTEGRNAKFTISGSAFGASDVLTITPDNMTEADGVKTYSVQDGLLTICINADNTCDMALRGNSHTIQSHLKRVK